jgi:hypothetical protein
MTDSTSRLLAMDFNTGTITVLLNYTLQISRHYGARLSIPLLPNSYSGGLASRNSADSLPFLLNHLRLPSQETPSVLYLSCLRSSLYSLGAPSPPPQKTPFPTNSSSVTELCLPRLPIQTVVRLCLLACLFLQEPVCRVVA